MDIPKGLIRRRDAKRRKRSGVTSRVGVSPKHRGGTVVHIEMSLKVHNRGSLSLERCVKTED